MQLEYNDISLNILSNLSFINSTLLTRTNIEILHNTDISSSNLRTIEGYFNIKNPGNSQISGILGFF